MPFVKRRSTEVTGLPAEFQSVPFDTADARGALAAIPEDCAVFALYGEAQNAQPYIGRTPNLRGRLARLLIPSPKHPKRLQLAGQVRRIEWRLTGSEFESLLLQFDLLQKVYGAKALERMHLGAPTFVRFLGGNPYPRLTVINRPNMRDAHWVYGPFASRAAAERFVDEALKLFLLRRCTEDLEPDPSHPGCVYSEMKMCLAPCYKGCSDERYAEEAGAVRDFVATRGDSRLVQLSAQRDEASANLEFEQAAALHAQVQKVEAVRALAPEIVRPLDQLRAVILQPSAVELNALPAPDVSIFLYEGGRLCGPANYSTVGMRVQNEQSGSSSLFAQPMSLEAVPEEDRQQDEKQPATGNRQQAATARGVLEGRLEDVLRALASDQESPNATARQGHLALLKRWYYRPEVKRPGEIFFPNEHGEWPVKAILRGIGRVAAKSLTAAAKA
jgi:hypothetical protein